MIDAEDFESEQAQRAAAERMSGWNGSQALYVPEPYVWAPCPADVRARLDAARDAAARRAAVSRARGLSL